MVAENAHAGIQPALETISFAPRAIATAAAPLPSVAGRTIS